MGFFVPTQEEIDEIRAQLIADAAAGVRITEVDGQRVELESLKSRLDALTRLETIVQTPSNAFGLRTVQLVSPGCGG